MLALARLSGLALAAVAAVGLAAAGAQDRRPAPAAPQDPAEGAARAAATAIWPAGLERLAGRYVFVQVASPGGLWERIAPRGGGAERGAPRLQQVAFPHLPAALRERLARAEIVISDLKLPTTVDAVERESPTKRGMLRYYTETTTGRLLLRNLPGIGGALDDDGNYSGPARFTLEHQSHSNPSVSGIFTQRLYQERTWGAATLDYASLQAEALPAGGRPSDPKPAPGAGAAKPRAARPAAGPEETEGELVIGNARVLRSGQEIFAFIEWIGEDAQGVRHVTGAVRLQRVQERPDPAGAPRPAP